MVIYSCPPSWPVLVRNEVIRQALKGLALTKVLDFSSCGILPGISLLPS